MQFRLSDSELKQLQELQADASMSRRQYIKITVLVMLHQGLRVQQIQALLGIDDNTIYRHVKAYQKVGLHVYLSDNFVAYQGKLSKEQLTELDKYLEESCCKDAKTIAQWIFTKWGIYYTPTGLIPLLHRLGYVYKRSKTVPSKADEVKQQAFLEQELADILVEVNQSKAHLYYADGVHPIHQTHTGYGWIKKGTDYELPANTGRKRVNINSCINAKDPTDVVYNAPDRVNADSTQDLLEQLIAKHGTNKPIYVVMDNARYNYNKRLQEWVKNTPVELVYLPAYSPNLNLIERLWGFMKQDILRHQHFERYEEFRQKVLGFISDLTPYQKDLKTLLALNFRTVEGKSYAF